ncbi:uncharacterized protein LOC128337679 [Hemicordylus capensis]|uniref:uncharacterized protein LOC128337679 n=1 Tax=Hemicordylus capensis TaxID=884348 RepID=UPI0023030A15|nr:uncharacterized protein LOC128337679 [Hemicordylus capensis]
MFRSFLAANSARQGPVSLQDWVLVVPENGHTSCIVLPWSQVGQDNPTREMHLVHKARSSLQGPVSLQDWVLVVPENGHTSCIVLPWSQVGHDNPTREMHLVHTARSSLQDSARQGPVSLQDWVLVVPENGHTSCIVLPWSQVGQDNPTREMHLVHKARSSLQGEYPMLCSFLTANSARQRAVSLQTWPLCSPRTLWNSGLYNSRLQAWVPIVLETGRQGCE